VPVAQEYFGDEQHPDLYLSVFSREHRGVCGVAAGLKFVASPRHTGYRRVS
jgi:hypothetical protein